MTISPGQKTALVTLLKACVGEDMARDARLWVTGRLLQRNIATYNDLNEYDWKKIRNSAYLVDDNGQFDFEAISPVFKAGVNALYRHFQEKILGQEKLF